MRTNCKRKQAGKQSKDIRRDIFIDMRSLSVGMNIQEQHKNTITVRFVKPTISLFGWLCFVVVVVELTEWWCGNFWTETELKNLYLYHTHTYKSDKKVKCIKPIEYDGAACVRYYHYYYYTKEEKKIKEKKRDDLIFWDPLMVMLTTNSSDATREWEQQRCIFYLYMHAKCSTV